MLWAGLKAAGENKYGVFLRQAIAKSRVFGKPSAPRLGNAVKFASLRGTK